MSAADYEPAAASPAADPGPAAPVVYATGLSPALRLVLLTSGVVITVAGLRLAAPLLVPVALALFITVVSLPILRRLMARGVRAWAAVLAVLVLDIAVVFVVGLLLARSLAGLGAAVPLYMERLGAAEVSLLEWLANRGLFVSAVPYRELLPSEHLVDMVTGLLRGATGLMANVFLVALITVFLMLESAVFPRKLQVAFGTRTARFEWLAAVLVQVQEYLALKTLISAFTGLLIGAAAWLLGVEFALLWGLLAFFLNFIPNVGSILAAVPAVFIALLQHGLTTAVALAAVYLGVNTVVGNLIEPTVMGRRLGLSALVVILSLVFWGWVWGPVGMFLSVPLAMAARIALDNTTHYRWLAVMMAGDPR